MGERELHAHYSHFPATAFSSSVRKPSPAEIRHFGERASMLLEMPHPRIKLASGIYGLTGSAAFSWRAASALHLFYPKEGEGRLALTAPQRAMLASASRLMLHAFNGSEDEAFRIACTVGRLAQCRHDHAVGFMHALSYAAGESPVFVRKALEGFPESTAEPSILRQYSRTLFLVYAAGGEAPAIEFAALFSCVAPFPESAHLMAESLAFSLERMRITDVDAFVKSFAMGWMGTLRSAAFRENPPD